MPKLSICSKNLAIMLYTLFQLVSVSCISSWRGLSIICIDTTVSFAGRFRGVHNFAAFPLQLRHHFWPLLYNVITHMGRIGYLSHFWGYVTALMLAALSNTMHKILPCNWEMILCFSSLAGFTATCTSHRAIVSNYKFFILIWQMTAKQESVDKEVHKSLGKVKYSTYSSFFFFSPNVETSIIPCVGANYMLAVCSKGPKHQWNFKTCLPPSTTMEIFHYHHY